MLDGLTYDDRDPPSITMVPAGVSWDEVRDHIEDRARSSCSCRRLRRHAAGSYGMGTAMVGLDRLASTST